MDNLKQKTARGLLWGALNNGSMQVLNLLIGLVLGRLLSPGEYGIAGVLTIFTVIAGNLQSSGFSQGLINLKRPTDEDYNSVFWFNVCVSLVLYALLFAAAPLIAGFFRQPVLIEVSRVVFLAFVISSFGIAQNAYMMKNMMQREIAVSSVAALALSGGVSIALALSGKSYWSLVWQQIVYITVLNAGRYFYSPWRPSLRFSIGPIRRMFAFSVKILFTNILNTLSQNLLTFIFGRLFPISTVGNFSQANKWNTMASTTIANTLHQVAQPVLVSVRDERQRELKVFRKMVRFTAFLSFPALFGLALVAREFILCTIGPAWTGCVPLLQLLCVSGAFMPLTTLYQNLVISHGRSDVNLWLNIGQIVVQIAIVLLFYRQGVTVMVLVYSLFNIVWTAAWQPFARRLIGLGWLSLLSDTAPFMLIAAATTGLTHWLTLGIGDLRLLLLARIVTAAALYYAAMRLLHVAILQECMQFIKRK